jgi:hypothetical protein
MPMVELTTTPGSRALHRKVPGGQVLVDALGGLF